jgi:hypothetical protein
MGYNECGDVALTPVLARDAPAEGPGRSMKPQLTKKPAPPKKRKSFQQLFDKWFLPVIFVGIGSVMLWALWRQ